MAAQGLMHLKPGTGKPGATDTTPAMILPKQAAPRMPTRKVTGQPALLTPGEYVLNPQAANPLDAIVEEYENTGLVDGQEPTPKLLAIIQQVMAGGDEQGDPDEAMEGHAGGGIVQGIKDLFTPNNVLQNRREVEAMKAGTYQGQPEPAPAPAGTPSSSLAQPGTAPAAGQGITNAITALSGRKAQIDRVVNEAQGYAGGGVIKNGFEPTMRNVGGNPESVQYRGARPASTSFTTNSGLRSPSTALTNPVNTAMSPTPVNPSVSTGMAGKQLVTAPKAPVYTGPSPGTINVPPGGFSPEPAYDPNLKAKADAQAAKMQAARANLGNNGMGGNAPPVGPPPEMNMPGNSNASNAAATGAAVASRGLPLTGMAAKALGGVGAMLYSPNVGEGSDKVSNNQGFTDPGFGDSMKRHNDVLQRRGTTGKPPLPNNVGIDKPTPAMSVPASGGSLSNQRVGYNLDSQGGIEKVTGGKVAPINAGLNILPSGANINRPGSNIESAMDFARNMEGDSFLGSRQTKADGTLWNGPATAAQKLEAYNRLTGQTSAPAMGAGMPGVRTNVYGQIAPAIQEPSKWEMDTAAWNATHGSGDLRKTDQLRYANLLDRQKRSRDLQGQGPLTPEGLLKNQTDQQHNAMGLAELQSGMDYRNKHLQLEQDRLGRNENPANDYLKGLYGDLDKARQAGDTAQYGNILKMIQQINPPKTDKTEGVKWLSEKAADGSDKHFRIENGVKVYASSRTPQRVSQIQQGIEAGRAAGLSNKQILLKLQQGLLNANANPDEFSDLWAQLGDEQ